LTGTPIVWTTEREEMKEDRTEEVAKKKKRKVE